MKKWESRLKSITNYTIMIRSMILKWLKESWWKLQKYLFHQYACTRTNLELVIKLKLLGTWNAMAEEFATEIETRTVQWTPSVKAEWLARGIRKKKIVKKKNTVNNNYFVVYCACLPLSYIRILNIKYPKLVLLH